MKPGGRILVCPQQCAVQTHMLETYKVEVEKKKKKKVGIVKVGIIISCGESVWSPKQRSPSDQKIKYSLIIDYDRAWFSIIEWGIEKLLRRCGRIMSIQ